MKTISKNKLTYRRSTCALVVNKNNKIVIVQKNSYGDNEWDIPGGGVENDESPEQAILRELKEELGSEKFEIIKVSRNLDRYDWPDEVIQKRISEGRTPYLGQERAQFLVKFTGKENEINKNNSELKQIKLVSLSDLVDYLVFPNQYKRLKLVLDEFNLI